MPNPRALALALGLLVLACPASAQDPAPQVLTYKTVAGAALKAHVFAPGRAATGPVPAVVLFHGGGWDSGDGTWMYPSARRFAKLGLVAVAVDYRLSDQKTTTPLEAMADARDAIRWVRAQASSLGVDPKRVAAYGVSAGGHLAFATAVAAPETAPDPAGRPDALLLVSPAIAISHSRWAGELLLGRAKPEEISPDQLVRAGLPPTFIVQGDEDAVTPAGGAAQFAQRMQAAGNLCELRHYAGVGHLLTRNLDEQEWGFDPDPVARQDAWRAEEAFLAARGFIATQPAPPQRPESVVRALVAALNARDLAGALDLTAEGVVWTESEGDPARADLQGRKALQGFLEAAFKRTPSLHRDLHMLTPNGAYVTVRERATWKTDQGEARSQNRLAVFQVGEGKVRRAWLFPAQP